MRKQIELSNEVARELAGPGDVVMQTLESRLDCDVFLRGNVLTLDGSDEEVALGETIVRELTDLIRQGHEIAPGTIEAITNALDAHESPSRILEDVVLRHRSLKVAPKTANQAAYLRALDHHDLVFALGPAGTGKTYLAVAMAVALLKQRRIERIVLSRPAVEAGERLGFLPGDLKEKVDPYMRPLYDALQDMLPEGKLQQRIDAGQIEIAPLAYMRGRTLSNSYVILDEAQNTTPSQMKMFLTRMGENSRMIITGDPSQTDLPPGMPSGLSDAVRKLASLQAVGVVHFDKKDVVRHPLVGAIIEAYETAARQAAHPNEETPPTPPGVANVSEHGQRQ